MPKFDFLLGLPERNHNTIGKPVALSKRKIRSSMTIKIIFLLFFGWNVSSYALPFGRELKDADCGQIIGMITFDEVRLMGTSFLSVPYHRE